jgi:hypothetical protein
LDTLWAYYSLDDATDAHTTNVDLTETGTVGYVTGKDGNALDAGTGPGYLTESGTTAFPMNDASYTVSLWFKTPDNSVDQAIWSWEAFGGVALRLTGGTLTVWHYDGGWQSASDATTLSNDTWYHIVVRYDKDASELSLFLNGVENTSGSIGVLNASSSPVLYIGTESWGYQSNGVLDEFGVWGRALSDTEVADLYNSGSGLFYASF